MVDARTVPTPANPRKPRLSQIRPGGVPVQGGGYLEGRPVLVNPAFSASFRRLRKNRKTSENGSTLNRFAIGKPK
jgi:hypothetical protein